MIAATQKAAFYVNISTQILLNSTQFSNTIKC